MADPYERGMFERSPYSRREAVAGRIVAILRARAEDRGLELISAPSRALVRGEVHELIATLEEATPGRRVDRISYIGFFEVLNSGVVVAGDRVVCESGELGRLAGFDLTHFPNHMNIVLRSESAMTGEEIGIEVGATIQFLGPDAVTSGPGAR